MNEVTQSPAVGGFLVSEANGSLSREIIILAEGEKLETGTVLGCVSVGTAAGAAASGNTGNGTIGTVSAGATAKPGVYTAICIEPVANAGAFEVEDPEGVIIGRATVGVAFAGEVNFTIADGATDFAPGDRFLITVAFGTGEYKGLDLAATDGTQRATAILYAPVNATDDAQNGVAIIRQAEVNLAELIWPAGITTDQKTAALVALEERGLIAR